MNKSFLYQIKAFFIFCPGRGTVCMLQRIIVLCNWVLLCGTSFSILFEFINQKYGGWWQFLENYTIGIVCSSIIVLFTTLVQFFSERDKAFDTYYHDIFMMLSSFNDAVIAKKHKNIPELNIVLNHLQEDIQKYKVNNNVMFWFLRKYETVYHQLEVELFALISKQDKQVPYEDIMVDEKTVDRVIMYANGFIKLIRPKNFSIFDIFVLSDKTDESQTGKKNEQP